MLIETVKLQTDDLHLLAQFYGERLELPTHSAERLVIVAGATQMIFQQVEGFNGRYHFAFNIPENRLDACLAFLAEREIPLIADAGGATVFDFGSWDSHSVYFYDPAGNIVEFIARHELPNSAPDQGSFSPDEILNVSEVGLACHDVLAFAEQVKAVGGIGEYCDASPAFMPLGDANGLFILVPLGRIWFPDTNVPAEIHPVEVTALNANGERFTITSHQD